jgi:hypothetical protein
MERKFLMVRTTVIHNNGVHVMARKRVLLWKALVGTLQRPGASFLGDAPGAYVNVVASAPDPEELSDKITIALNELGLQLMDLEAEHLPVKLSQAHVSDEIRTMAKTVREKGSVAFGEFYVFSEPTTESS